MSDPRGRGQFLLERGAHHLSTFVQIPDPNVIEILGRTALDSVILDCQHGMFSGSNIAPALAAAALGDKPAFVRIPVGDYAFASRALDLGAAGIICPMINNAAQAREFVDYVKYPPLGARSWGPRRALPLSGLSGQDFLRQSNARTIALVMLETREAIDHCEEILAVEGVDGVFVGPTDLAVSLSEGTSLDVASDPVIAALDEVGASCRRHDKYAGTFALNAAQTVGHVRRGYNFIALAQDAMFMSQAADQACAEVRAQLAAKKAS